MEFLSAHKCRAQITISLSTIRMHFYISRQCVECCILEFVATNVGPVMICQEVQVYTYRVCQEWLSPLWSYVQGTVFNTYSWFISQIKAKGCTNRLAESHFWCCHFWRENSNVCYSSAWGNKNLNETFFYEFDCWGCPRLSYVTLKICTRQSFQKIVNTISQWFKIIKKCLILIFIVCAAP